MLYYTLVMNNQAKIEKIKDIQAKFLKKVHKLEKDRDEKISVIKKGIDQRKIDALLKELKK